MTETEVRTADPPVESSPKVRRSRSRAALGAAIGLVVIAVLALPSIQGKPLLRIESEATSYISNSFEVSGFVSNAGRSEADNVTLQFRLMTLDGRELSKGRTNIGSIVVGKRVPYTATLLLSGEQPSQVTHEDSLTWTESRWLLISTQVTRTGKGETSDHVIPRVPTAASGYGTLKPLGLSVVATIPLGIRPLVLAYGEGALWAANVRDNTVSRIDPSTNKVVATVSVGEAPTSVAVGAGAVWVTNAGDGNLSKIDPLTNRVIATIPAGKVPVAVVVSNGAIWVADSEGSAVLRLDPSSARLVATIAVGKEPAALALGEGAVWVSNYGDDTVSRIDSTTNAVVATIPVGAHPRFVGVGQGGVWVPCLSSPEGEGSLIRIDPATNMVVATFQGGHPSGVAFTESGVWVVQAGDDAVLLLDPKQNRFVAETRATSDSIMVVVANQALWVLHPFVRNARSADLVPGTVDRIALP